MMNKNLLFAVVALTVGLIFLVLTLLRLIVLGDVFALTCFIVGVGLVAGAAFMGSDLRKRGEFPDDDSDDDDNDGYGSRVQVRA